MRGMAKGPLVDKDFFIILDRLHGTLDQRINTWYHTEKRHKGIGFGIGRNKQVLRQLMVERMTVAYDLAAGKPLFGGCPVVLPYHLEAFSNCVFFCV